MTAASETLVARVCKRQPNSGQLLYLSREDADRLGLREGTRIGVRLRRRGQ